MDLDVYLTFSQVAQALGRSYAQVRRLAMNHQLPVRQRNGRRRVALNDLTRLFPEAAGRILLTTGQTARYLNLLTEDVRQMVRCGKLTPIPSGSHMRFRLPDLQRVRDEAG